MADDGEVTYAEKLRSIGFLQRKGSRRARPVERDSGPGDAGVHIDHWDGRVDAVVVNPRTTLLHPIAREDDHARTRP